MYSPVCAALESRKVVGKKLEPNMLEDCGLTSLTDSEVILNLVFKCQIEGLAVLTPVFWHLEPTGVSMFYIGMLVLIPSVTPMKVAVLCAVLHATC